MRARRDEKGAAAIIAIMVVAFLFAGLAALSVDVGQAYSQIGRAQKAADAAALAGVTYMPQDFASASATALDVAARNGFPNGGNITVDVRPGSRPSELRVTISTRFTNSFGKMIGVPTTTISRSALADYTGPQPMGSPCNTLGNEPAGSAGAGPVASQLSVPAGATCPRLPQFWMTVHGPNVYKTQGDEYHVRTCQGGESGCSAAKANTEYRPEGYFLLVRVAPAAVGSAVTLQLYDPAYVSTTSDCGSIPTGNITSNDWNDYATTDAKTRYANSSNEWCTGDDPNSSLRVGSETPTITSYALRGPTQDFNPLSSTPMSGCTRQYPGYTTPTANQLKKGNASYNENLARVFHQWVPLCTFTPTKSGDYYLQVRTNVPMGGTVNDTGSYKPSSATTSAVATQTGDNTTVTGNGSNRFAVRAFGGPAASVSVSAYGKMPIFANANTAAPTFNLIRVLPGAAGKSLVFSFFDVGDAASSGTLTVLRPTEATGNALTNCLASGFKTQTLSTCSIGGISSSAGWNGQGENIVVPIPANYTCNYTSPAGCWFRVQVNFGTGSVTDATTWTASVRGDPVRLLE
ncbi:MAG: pilus assembly protein TadG-related protein [Nocardioides sp.]